MMVKVVVSCPRERIYRYNVQPPAGFTLEYIKTPYTDEELIEAGEGATFLFLSLSPAGKAVIEQLKSTLKLIQSEGVGYDGIDIEAAREAGIYVCNAKGVNKVAVAEHTTGLILAALRRTAEADREIKRGNFVSSYQDYEEKGMRELQSCHVGLVGLGDIGKETAKRLYAFGCRISYCDVIRQPELEQELGLQFITLEELYRTCDIISLHVPLLPETENLINKDTIALMRKDAIIINTARGPIINQQDLAQALIEGRIEGAAIDTLSPQPPGKDHPLLNLPEEAANRLTLTTHIAGITTQAFTNMQITAWNNMKKVLNGQRPDNIVNGL